MKYIEVVCKMTIWHPFSSDLYPNMSIEEAEAFEYEREDAEVLNSLIEAENFVLEITNVHTIDESEKV